MARINSWYNFQADEIYVSRVINQHTVQVKEIVVYLSTTENLKLFEDDLEGHQNFTSQGEQAQRSDHRRHRTDCSKVVQESRLFQVEWLAEHRH